MSPLFDLGPPPLPPPLSILHVLRGGGLLSFLLRDPPPYLNTTSALLWPGAGGPGGGGEKGILSALAVPPVHLPTNFPLHGPDLMAARGRAVNTVISKELDTDLPLNRSERPLFMSVVRWDVTPLDMIRPETGAFSRNRSPWNLADCWTLAIGKEIRVRGLDRDTSGKT